jgi:hypothetical protein
MPRDEKGHRRPRSNIESIVTGLVIGGGFIAWWAFNGHADWALIGAFFGGLLPVSRGVSGLITARGAAPGVKRLGEKERSLENERAVLQMARNSGGRLTPGLVALDCSMSVEEAERVLDGLVKKGHSSMMVRDDGRIEYEFSEFLPALPQH